MKNQLIRWLVAISMSTVLGGAFAQGTAFTYQGRLFDGNALATGTYDMRFYLYDAFTGGSIVAGPITNAPVTVSNGLFSVALDFGGGVFTGPSRWLDIGVRSNGTAIAYSGLSPRQELKPSPYAIFAEGANAAGLSGTLPSTDLGGTYSGALTFNNAGNSFTGNGSGLTGVNAATLGGLGANNFWKTVGNAGTTPGVNFVGTTDNQALEFHVGGSRGLVLLPDPNGFGEVNVVGGAANNAVGGFSSGTFVGGGYGNVANGSDSTVAGGFENYNQASSSSLSGGSYNQIGLNGQAAAIGGGSYNTNNGQYATIPGGYQNLATGSESFAAGTEAQALHGGSFVWADSSVIAPFASTAVNQFLVRAAGGVGINTFSPGYSLDVRDSPSSLSGTIHVGANATGGDPKVVKFGDGDYVHVGENGVDDRMELKAGTFFFTHVGFESGYVGINTATPQQALDVNGEFMVVDGLGNEQAYLGGDGAGNDVQIGSLRSGVTAVAAYNATDNAYMHFYCSSITIEGGADLAEPFKISAGDALVPQGAVVVIDKGNPGQLKMSDQPYDRHVAGVVSGANGVSPGIQMQQQGLLAGGRNVALTGRVYVLADASNGSIEPGDLLTTSSAPGHAMKVTDYSKAQGAILGKAMTGLDKGNGMVLVLVTLQ